MAAPLDELAGGERQPLAADVEPLLAFLDQAARIAEATGEAREFHGRFAQQSDHAAGQSLGVVQRLGQEVGAHRHGHLGRRGRRRRAAVGGEVDQGGVGLVADRRDQRDLRSRGGAHHDLLVEGPEILEAAAAARHDQHVGPRHRAADRPAD